MSISEQSVSICNVQILAITVENWRWLCVFSTNYTYLQIKYNTQNLNYQIYHNQCQFFVIASIFLVFVVVSNCATWKFLFLKFQVRSLSFRFQISHSHFCRLKCKCLLILSLDKYSHLFLRKFIRFHFCYLQLVDSCFVSRFHRK